MTTPGVADDTDTSTPLSRLIDLLAAAAILLGIGGLFYVDISYPRGVVDGVGYAAIVAISVRFGGGAVLVCAMVTTTLVALAAFLLPDSGISVTGELANRFFAVVTLWIVALVLLRRLSLEQYVAGRDAVLKLHQNALLAAVHEALLSNKPFERRIQRITEIAAEPLQAGRVGVFRLIEGRGMLRCVDMWQRDIRKHSVVPDVLENASSDYLKEIRESLVAIANDVLTVPYLRVREALFAQLNIRALLAFGVFVEGRLVGQLTFANLGQPRIWTAEETAFGHAMASFVALLFAADRSAQTLAALDLVGEGIYTANDHGDVFYANRAASEMAAQGQTVGLAPLYFPKPTAPLSGTTDMHEVRFAGMDLEIRRARLPGGGIITRLNDVSARNSAVRDRAYLQARLQQVAKMEAIGQLAGGVAHDFNNILGSIMGFAGFLEQDLPPASDERGFAIRILAACERGKSLIEQILDFARARIVERNIVDLELVVQQAGEQVAKLLTPAIAFKVECDAPVAFAAGSAGQLSQLIFNLCLNARDAIGDRPGAIALKLKRAETREIETLDTGGDGDLIVGDADPLREYGCIEIADNGDGIAPEVLPRIFEPFFTTKGRQRGTGLGLAVVHGIVASHNGVCRVRTAPGQGTTFALYIPLVRAGAADPAPSDTNVASVRGTERIIVVDDEADIVDMLTIGLIRLGYDAVGVDDPREVLTALREDPTACDVVVTDQVMPAMRGLDLIRAIKASYPQINTILCTGFSDGADENVSLEAGADAFFRKPVDATAVAKKIRQLRMRMPTN